MYVAFGVAFICKLRLITINHINLYTIIVMYLKCKKGLVVFNKTKTTMQGDCYVINKF